MSEKAKSIHNAYCDYEIAKASRPPQIYSVKPKRKSVLFVNLSAPDVFFFMQVKRRYRTKQSDIFFSRLFYPVPSCIILVM